MKTVQNLIVGTMVPLSEYSQQDEAVSHFSDMAASKKVKEMFDIFSTKDTKPLMLPFIPAQYHV